MAFGVYVHIPYCLQRCVYCDFATYELSQILVPQDYIKRVIQEIKTKSNYIGPRQLDTLYFGGGTPSLIEPKLLQSIILALKDSGFPLKNESEVTLEINPATTSEENLKELLSYGFNRFSVGAQTFNDGFLKTARRKHSAEDTSNTLRLLESYSLNFNLDLLFALPGQTLEDLKKDLSMALEFHPSHISPYCLTVPDSNPMAKGRAPENEQIQMFALIKNVLEKSLFNRYEISNFSKKDMESKHNLLYWNDDEYWGIGLSSHSYLHKENWGLRFWNPRNIHEYIADTDKGNMNWENANQHEVLRKNQALTDFFHISLRKSSGLDCQQFEKKFGAPLLSLAGPQINKLIQHGWIENIGKYYRFTETGLLLSNKVFEELTFLSV